MDTTFKEQVNDLYERAGGRDIDAAIARDRNLLALHDRELEHVATLPFDQHYRWRVAPSLMLRAQKDLEHQLERRADLLEYCKQCIRAQNAQPAAQPAAAEAKAESAESLLETGAKLEATLSSVLQVLAEQGIDMGGELEPTAAARAPATQAA